jgi:transposase
VRKIIKDSGMKLFIHYSYSPRLNPIEQFFNQPKYLYERVMNLRELKESVDRVLEKVKSSLLCV